jgi:acyl-CoA synthetase (AMP-forming)/AMP-acid ligase II
MSTGTRTRASDLIFDGLGNVDFLIGGERMSATTLLSGSTTWCSPHADAAAIAALLTNDRDTVELILRCIAAGVTLVSLPLPSRGEDVAQYVSFIRATIASYGVQEVVARHDHADLLRSLGIASRSHSEIRSGSLVSAGEGGFRLVQYTSGSTAAPKAVALDDAQLGVNLASIIDAVEPNPGDQAVSWLPLSHDMGLVGMLLTSIASGSDRFAGHGSIALLDPLEYLRRPVSWLESITELRGTFTAAPDFGYRYAQQHAPAASCDLSSLRCAIVGGEIVRATTLRSFSTTFSSAGFRDGALCPAYGLAELGLAATMTRPDEGWRSKHLSSRSIAEFRCASPDGAESALDLVSSGRPLDGYLIRCDAAVGAIGPIEIFAPSAGRDPLLGTSFASASGWLRTSDVGFLADGWLFVCGRFDDYFTTRGRNVFAPTLEDRMGEIDGVRQGRVVVVGLPAGGWVVMLEPDASSDGSSATEVSDAVRQAAREACGSTPDEVLVLGRGELPMTSSGKVRRREALRAYLQHSSS